MWNWPLLLMLGCAAPSATSLDLPPDADRTGTDGTFGPYGAAHARFQASARLDDLVEYEVSWPSDAGGSVHAAGPFPVVMWVPGGFVSVSQYRWMATHLASRGYVVVAADHDLRLAILQSENTLIAYDNARERAAETGGVLSGAMGTRVAVAGHSLGGAVAANLWVADPAIDGLILVASWPAEAADIEGQRGRASLSLIGSEDQSGEATERAYEAYERFDEPRWFGVVDGMNHYDWVDDATRRELESDGTPTRPQKQTRPNAMAVIDTWLDATLKADELSRDRLEARDFHGIGDQP